MAITVYLLRRGKPLVYTLLPMAFVLVSTLTAMSSNLATLKGMPSCCSS